MTGTTVTRQLRPGLVKTHWVGGDKKGMKQVNLTFIVHYVHHSTSICFCEVIKSQVLNEKFYCVETNILTALPFNVNVFSKGLLLLFCI